MNSSIRPLGFIGNLIIGFLFLGFMSFAYAQYSNSANTIYQTHCASCHGSDRLGGTGPALLPGNLERLRRPQASKTISEGRLATQMPGFSKILR